VQGKANLDAWEPSEKIQNAMEAFQHTLLQEAADLIQVALDSGESSCSFPILYADEHGKGDGHECGDTAPRSASPDEIFLTIGDFANINESCSEPVIAFNYRDEISDQIAMLKDDSGKADGLRKLMEIFREIADEIDAALKEVQE
jgi:hypothetical protein